MELTETQKDAIRQSNDLLQQAGLAPVSLLMTVLASKEGLVLFLLEVLDKLEKGSMPYLHIRSALNSIDRAGLEGGSQPRLDNQFAATLQNLVDVESTLYEAICKLRQQTLDL